MVIRIVQADVCDVDFLMIIDIWVCSFMYRFECLRFLNILLYDIVYTKMNKGSSYLDSKINSVFSLFVRVLTKSSFFNRVDDIVWNAV